MPRFRFRSRPRPNEVSVAIAEDGVTACVWPPENARGESGARDIRLSSALHLAGALADRLGTDVGLLENTDTLYFVEDVVGPDGRMQDVVFVPPGAVFIKSH